MEQLLQWCLLQSERRTNERRDSLVSALREQLDAGKREIMEAHGRAVEAAAASESGGKWAEEASPAEVTEEPRPRPARGRRGGEENANPQKQQQQADGKESGVGEKKAMAAKKDKNFGVVKVVATVIDGLYGGKSYVLKPTPRYPCFIGRSAGKKFRDRGMSMPNDGEVSTTHGKVEIRAGKAYYTDVGSTNGTLLGGEDLEVNAPLELTEGMELLIGAETVRFTLAYD